MQLTHKQKTHKHPSNSDRALPLTNPPLFCQLGFFDSPERVKRIERKERIKRVIKGDFNKGGLGRSTGMVVSMIACALIALLV